MTKLLPVLVLMPALAWGGLVDSVWVGSQRVQEAWPPHASVRHYIQCPAGYTIKSVAGWATLPGGGHEGLHLTALRMAPNWNRSGYDRGWMYVQNVTGGPLWDATLSVQGVCEKWE